MSREIVIGLEIHLKIASASKLFCACANEQDFDNLAPNTHICPVCTGQPGALPVLQKEPLQLAVLLGLALGCDVQHYSSFDRKSYFYPDLPMGYQITQQHAPTNIDGSVTFFVDKAFTTTKKITIRDAHIETDTGKTTQVPG
jgi:aspartyl-tRNA(Asn)/glutamyl-tRNA(Gln) amidotransferase subunit B